MRHRSHKCSERIVRRRFQNGAREERQNDRCDARRSPSSTGARPRRLVAFRPRRRPVIDLQSDQFSARRDFVATTPDEEPLRALESHSCGLSTQALRQPRKGMRWIQKSCGGSNNAFFSRRRAMPTVWMNRPPSLSTRRTHVRLSANLESSKNLAVSGISDFSPSGEVGGESMPGQPYPSKRSNRVTNDLQRRVGI